MLTATSTFMDSLDQWLQAAKKNDFDAAKHHAEFLVKASELLMIHPDFVRCFGKHTPGVKPKDAMLHFCQVLVCATEGRAVVLKRWVAENIPTTASDPPPSE